MKTKQSLIIKDLPIKDLKIGDIVRMTDGSSFSSDNTDEPLYIVDTYYNLTGSHERIKDIYAEVVETGITNRVIYGYTYVFLQDIVVKIGKGLFRTSSAMVTKIDNITCIGDGVYVRNNGFALEVAVNDHRNVVVHLDAEVLEALIQYAKDTQLIKSS